MKYNNEIYSTTEYSEALAFFYYCEINNINFDFEIAKRNKYKLKLFPDFILEDCYLEVTRAIDAISGKQQKDVLEVFGHSDSNQRAISKNKELKKYKGDYNHYIKFGVYKGVVFSYNPVKSFAEIIDIIKERIKSKSESIDSHDCQKYVDLFVVNFEILDVSVFKKIFDWFKHSSINNIRNVYINFLNQKDNSSVYVAIFSKTQLITKKILKNIDKNMLIQKIYELGWLENSKFDYN